MAHGMCVYGTQYVLGLHTVCAWIAHCMSLDGSHYVNGTQYVHIGSDEHVLGDLLMLLTSAPLYSHSLSSVQHERKPQVY